MKDSTMTIEQATAILIANKNGTAQYDIETIEQAQQVELDYAR